MVGRWLNRTRPGVEANFAYDLLKYALGPTLVGGISAAWGYLAEIPGPVLVLLLVIWVYVTFVAAGSYIARAHLQRELQVEQQARQTLEQRVAILEQERDRKQLRGF